MNPNVLRELAQSRLAELYGEIREIKAAIAALKGEGLIAAKGTAIASYKARSGTGEYWEYFKLRDEGNRALIHIGKEGSPWLQLFREAIARRTQIENLERRKAEIINEIQQLHSALKQQQQAIALLQP